MNAKIENVLKKIVQIIAIILLVFLTVASAFGTAHMNKDESTSYLSDNPIMHIIAICAVIAIIKFIRKKEIKISKKTIIICISIWLVIIIVWILMTQLYGRVDQGFILNIADDLLHGDTSGFENNKYAGSNPHQIGLILFETVTGIFFGGFNFLGLQFLNIIAILVSIFAIYRITRILFKNRLTSIGTILALFLFAPLSFYVTFIYGNLYGLATSMVAVWCLLIYLENKKIRYVFLSAINIELAVLFKSNYMITLVAMICLIILYVIKEKRLKTLISIFVLVAVYFAGSLGINFITKAITGKEKNEGIPMKAYIVMGLQEGSRAPGWYNGYNRSVYKKSKYNAEKAEEKVNEDLKKCIEKFVSDPGYAINFLYYKTLSQWNNPTFQSLWIYRSREANIPANALVRSIKGEGTAHKLIIMYMNIIQTLILFGATAYFILDFKNIKSKQLVLIIIFIGGFLFHLVWEAKGQYTFTYFIMLIPYAVRGFYKLSYVNLHKNSISDKIRKIKGSQE